MKYISFTKDDDYASRKAAIARQEKLAEMLSQMGAQEQAVSTAGGITAPISGMGALARGLTSFGGSYLSGKAERDAAALDKASLENAADKAEALYTLGGIEGGTFKLGEPAMETPMQGIPDSSKVQPRDIGQTMPREITLGDVSLGAPSYEDQQRLLRGYRRSSDPNLRQVATDEGARIEAENLYKRGRTDTAADLADRRASEAGIRGEARTQEIADKTKTPLKPEEVAKLGFRPGTVVYKDRFGNISVEQAPDYLSQEAFNQRLQLAAAGRAQGGLSPTPAILQADTRALAKATEASNAAVPTVQALERSMRTLLNPNTSANVFLPEFNLIDRTLALFGNDAAEKRATDVGLLTATGDIAGIAALAGIGGSDTERELAVATRTAYNRRGTNAENLDLTRKKLSAFRFVADYPLLANDWIAKYGSLHPTFKDEDGGTFARFADREYKRIRAEVNAMGAPAAGETVPTATGPNGQKIYLRNGQWVNK